MAATNARCSRCKQVFPSDIVLSVCKKCGGALLFEYDYAQIADTVSAKIFSEHADTFWKFLEVLPLSSSQNITSLGEPFTPIYSVSGALGFPCGDVVVKDDGRLPTGSFKARGMAVAVSKMKEFNVKHVAIPSAGNAAAALAAYGSKANMSVYVFMPKDVSPYFMKECSYLGAKVFLVDGLINDAAEVVARLKEEYGWIDLSTNKQPYRVEGYKAAAFEVAEQLKWDLPDHIIFPTGGGEGVIGFWKGVKELKELELVEKTCQLTIVQSSGCAPLVQAFRKGLKEVEKPWENAETVAQGLRVPNPYASYLILRAVRESEGTAVAVEDAEILSSLKAFLKLGIYACPEAAATLAAARKLEDEGAFSSDEKILLYLTGNALKHFDSLHLETSEIPTLRRDASTLPSAASQP